MMKTLAVFTGTRAEFGLLRRLLERLNKSDIIVPLLAVTGSHLAQEYGYTVTEIENSGIPISARLDILLFGQGELAIAKTIGYAIDIYSTWLDEIKPDAVLLLGDRYEIFAAATAAAALSIPIAHISGGDVTLGAKDDYYRHCITKMASCHFPSCNEYANRIIRMGEAPATVHNVGGLGDENIRTMPLLSKNDICDALSITNDTRYALVTYHPETVGNKDIKAQMHELLSALESSELFLIFSKANADAGGNEINAILEQYCKSHSNTRLYSSLGVLKYLSAMKYAQLVIGNSSSGVVETPSFGVPTVNIGTRQQGRIISDNIICCAPSQKNIEAAISTALSDEFIKKSAKTISPYNGGDTSKHIVSELERYITSPHLHEAKTFYDGEVT